MTAFSEGGDTRSASRPVDNRPFALVTQHLSNTVWAVAKLELPVDDGWLEELLVCSERAMPGYEPQHLANTLWGLAKMGIAPDDAWMRAFLRQLDHSAPRYVALAS